MPWSSGYLAEEERDNGAALKKAIEGVISDMAFALQSEKQLSALELASDRQIRRNASRGLRSSSVNVPVCDSITARAIDLRASLRQQSRSDRSSTRVTELLLPVLSSALHWAQGSKDLPLFGRGSSLALLRRRSASLRIALM
jgi:hypothetical protein